MLQSRADSGWGGQWFPSTATWIPVGSPTGDQVFLERAQKMQLLLSWASTASEFIEKLAGGTLHEGAHFLDETDLTVATCTAGGLQIDRGAIIELGLLQRTKDLCRMRKWSDALDYLSPQQQLVDGHYFL